MLKEHSKIIKASVISLDILLLCLAFWGSHFWRRQIGIIAPIERYFFLLYFSVPITIFSLYRQGLYGEVRFDNLKKIAWKTISSLVVAGVASSAILYLIHAGNVSRLLFGYYFILASFLLLLEKTSLKVLQNYLRIKGYNVRNILIVGSGHKLQHLFEFIEGKPEWGLRIVKSLYCSHNVLQEVKECLKKDVVDEVYIVLSRFAKEKCDIGTLLHAIEEYGKTIKVSINLDEELRISRVDFCHIGDLPALAFYSKTLDPDHLLFKRTMDLLGSFTGLIVSGILFPFIAAAIKLDSPGPLFFKQIRVGLNGRKFKIYKFRSMIADAETRKDELAARNEHEGPIFKLENDPRVTRVGRFLRRTSLDELPQFWNVLKGDMSLVGTRPPTPDEVEQYKAWHYRRISIRPGITGLWQVSGRNRIKNFDEIVQLDLKYINNWNIWMDCRILIKTVQALFQPADSGAR